MAGTSKFTFDFDTKLRRRTNKLATDDDRHLGPMVNILIREALDAREARARDATSPETVLADAEALLANDANRG